MAARAYDAAARRMRGDEAHGGRVRGNCLGTLRLNFPTEAEQSKYADIEAQRVERARSTQINVVAQAELLTREADGRPGLEGVRASFRLNCFVLLTNYFDAHMRAQEEPIAAVLSATNALRLAHGVELGLLGPGGECVGAGRECLLAQLDQFHEALPASFFAEWCNHALFTCVYGTQYAVPPIEGAQAMVSIAETVFDAAAVDCKFPCIFFLFVYFGAT